MFKIIKIGRNLTASPPHNKILIFKDHSLSWQIFRNGIVLQAYLLLSQPAYLCIKPIKFIIRHPPECRLWHRLLFMSVKKKGLVTIPHEAIKTQLAYCWFNRQKQQFNRNHFIVCNPVKSNWWFLDNMKKKIPTHIKGMKNALCEPCNEAAKLKWQQHLQKKNNTGIVPVVLLVVAA